MLLKKPASLLALSLLSGCSLIPAYHRPSMSVASEYPVAETGVGQAAADIGWKQFFKDPALQQLITLGLANNRNLQVSVLNVEEAQAQYRISRASLFPTINGNATFDRTHTPENLSAESDFREYSLGAQAVSWELDLFGKIRSKAASEHQLYLRQADTEKAASMALVAQIGAQYYTWLADREALHIAQMSEAADLHSLNLVQLELQNGVGTAIAVAQAQSSYDTAQTNVAQYQRQVAQDMDALVLLVGTPLPSGLLVQMQAIDGLSQEPALPRVPAGLPSDLLIRRPDIQAAEHALLAANANIGAARAAFFPSISLTATGGVASPGLNSLFSGGQGAWTFEPQITIPIFTAGENIANLDIANIEKKIQIANYQYTIQSAFRDVSDALSARQTYDTQVQAQENLVAADTRYYNLAQMRFQTGVDNYLNVLVAQNALLSAQLTLVNLQLAQQQNAITLYDALGGGWEAENTYQTTTSLPADKMPKPKPLHPKTSLLKTDPAKAPKILTNTRQYSAKLNRLPE